MACGADNQALNLEIVFVGQERVHNVVATQVAVDDGDGHQGLQVPRQPRQPLLHHAAHQVAKPLLFRQR